MLARMALATALAASAVAFSQTAPPKPRFGKAVLSPEVLADRRVVFRFFAPNAKAVSLEREDAKRAPLTKDEKGLWSLTTDPLEPDLYVYSYIVDGVQLADPANPLAKSIVTGGSESILEVSGPSPLPWEMRDVPHGVLHKHTFHSAVVGEERAFWVYTPPGYQPTAKKKLPVLYLLHGVMDDGTTWMGAGRVNVILDNLLAQAKVKPMLVVMPLGYGFANPADRVVDIFTRPADGQKYMDAMASSLMEEVMPEVERNYRVDAKPRSRAIAGVSMGGAQAMYIGLNHSDRFAWIGSFSGATIMYGNRDKYFPSLDSKVNNSLRMFTVACGTEDFLYKSTVDYRSWLNSKAIEFTPLDTPRGHTWLVWRRNLIDFASQLFR